MYNWADWGWYEAGWVEGTYESIIDEEVLPRHPAISPNFKWYQQENYSAQNAIILAMVMSFMETQIWDQ